MKINDYINPRKGNPLDDLVTDGGYVSIFRTIACIGDSLSSGEFQVETQENGVKTMHYYDFYEYSWGQFIARMTGSKVYNFSRGGMKACDYLNGFGDSILAFNNDKAAQAYIIAMGVNDLNHGYTIGNFEDTDFENYDKDSKNFIMHYAKLIQRYKEIQPDAFFFLVTLPKEDCDSPEKVALKEKYRSVLYKLCEKFSNCYVVDLYEYAPVYDAEFRKKFYLSGHMNAAGYYLTAKMIATLIDDIIRNNFEDFAQVGLIGTPYHKK